MAVCLLWSCLVCAFGQEADFEPLRFSVVRIESLTEEFNWLSPTGVGEVGKASGTGWVVSLDPPLVVTNTHVVKDSGVVAMQLFVHSNKKWPARVVGVCPTFDLALLEFEDPAELRRALEAANMSLRALELQEGPSAMGAPAVALGFPLGQQSLKISSGVIAGYQDINGNLCIQSTAPISPGSSGGPLVSADGSEVIGVNFASAAAQAAENVNFVIPAWRVAALLRSYVKRKAAGALGNASRALFRVPSADARTLQPNGALRAQSGCAQGIYIADLGARSFFAHAAPAVRPGSFLTKVAGIEIDEFGMGRNPAFVEEKVKYTDLFFMQPDLDGTVEVEACFEGATATHAVSLGWGAAYDTGVQYVAEPHFAQDDTQVEVFGDVAFMELTLNHVAALLKSRPEIARFLHPSAHADRESYVIVAHVNPGSYASDFVFAGDVVTTLNGQAVHSLADFRSAFLPEATRADVPPLFGRGKQGMQSGKYARRLGVGRTRDGPGLPTRLVGTVSLAEAEPRLVVSDEEEGAGDDGATVVPEDGGAPEDGAPEGTTTLTTTELNGTATPAGGQDAVWELRLDSGQVYAVFFREALEQQLLDAERAQARWQLSEAVLAAATALDLLGGPPLPFLASVLAGPQAAPSLAAVRSQLQRSVGFLAPAVRGEPEYDALVPTIERSMPVL